MRSLDEQRAALRGRQHEVTAALLRGEAPQGFGQVAARHTSRILLGKRADDVADGCPELTELPGWRARFAQYAGSHPAQGCAHTQLSDFTRWLRVAPDLGPPEREWLRVADVHASRKRATIAQIRGRRTILIGLGRQVWRLSLPARPRRHPGGFE
ncbi:hypothetical protein [Allobranchiibius huperziae]|uniref:SCO6045-like C-terminal domain-containing protein n=1 Tax=Allobranchiibius huperziae TaxID=1874116 RepID=A0A853DJD6_9MICO|nr:hypothetical protein [Allobranchiibius huperziae]NYJ76143.1 hypothetical protein [Allobranchiibius huperziae]